MPFLIFIIINMDVQIRYTCIFFLNLPVNSKENQNISTGEIIKGLILKYIMMFKKKWLSRFHYLVFRIHSAYFDCLPEEHIRYMYYYSQMKIQQNHVI